MEENIPSLEVIPRTELRSILANRQKKRKAKKKSKNANQNDQFVANAIADDDAWSAKSDEFGDV